jgi:hypothetical protein
MTAEKRKEIEQKETIKVVVAEFQSRRRPSAPAIDGAIEIEEGEDKKEVWKATRLARIELLQQSIIEGPIGPSPVWAARLLSF